MTDRVRDRLTIAGFALPGALLAHVGLYHALAPAAAHRQDLLNETGHAYLPLATVIALLAGFAAAVMTVRNGLGRRRRPRTASSPWSVRLARLAGAQIAVFVLAEVSERAIAGASLRSLGPVILLGIVLQIAAAGLWACVSKGLERLGEELARSWMYREPSAPRTRPRSLVPRAVDATAPTAARAPPSLLSA